MNNPHNFFFTSQLIIDREKNIIPVIQGEETILVFTKDGYQNYPYREKVEPPYFVLPLKKAIPFYYILYNNLYVLYKFGVINFRPYEEFLHNQQVIISTKFRLLKPMKTTGIFKKIKTLEEYYTISIV